MTALNPFMTEDHPVRKLAEALQKIAFGRDDNGRALGGEVARGLARDALSDCGLDWSPRARAKEAGNGD